MKKTILVLLLPCLVGCGNQFERKSVGGRFSIEVLNYMHEAKLNPEATLQYADDIDKCYLAVLEEGKLEFYKALEEGGIADAVGKNLNGYTKLLMENFNQSVKGGHSIPPSDIFINGLPAKIIELYGTVDKASFGYYIGIVEGKDNFYQVIGWSSLDNFKMNKKSIKRMVRSFKEIY